MISIASLHIKKEPISLILLSILTLSIISIIFFFSLQNKKTITIGGIVPLSGESTNLGHTIKEVTNLRIQEWNESGKLNGHKIEIVWKDGKCDYKTSQRAARELIETYHVPIIMGGLCSEETMGASSVTSLNKVLLFSPFSTSSEIEEQGEFIFSFIPNNRDQAQKISNYAITNKLSPLAVLTEDSSNSQNLLRELSTKYDGKLVTYFFDPLNQESVSAKVEQLKNSEAKGLLISVQSPLLFKNILKNLEDINWEKEIIFDETISGVAENLIYEFKGFFNKVSPLAFYSYKSIKQGEYETFKRDYFQKYGWRLKDHKYALEALDSIDFIIDALVISKFSFSPSRLNYTLLNSQKAGFTGGIKFNQNGLIDREYHLFRFNDDAFKIVE